jgi:hypothetical protein
MTMTRIMEFFKRILGFYSPYSWTKWIRIPFAAVALIIAAAFWMSFGGMLVGGGLIDLIFAVILFIIIFGPTLAVMIGISLVVGAVFGGIQSGKRQAQSLAESKATGDPEILALDQQRIKVQLVNTLFVVFIAVGFVGAFGVSYLLIQSDVTNEFVLYLPYIGAVILIGLFWLAKWPMNLRYKEAFRQQIVAKGLESVLQNMDFRPGERLDEKLVVASGLFPKYDTYSGNDFLAAEYKGIRFTQSDVHLAEDREETYTDKNGDFQTRVKSVTIFRGRVMVFDYDAISNEPVFVRPKSQKPGQDSILTELDAFNQIFSVVSKDAASAFRILTPPVLEGILQARNKIGCPLALSFKDDKIYAALFNGDSFEASAVGDATLSEQRKRVASEIESVLGMVETLYLKK